MDRFKGKPVGDYTEDELVDLCYEWSAIIDSMIVRDWDEPHLPDEAGVMFTDLYWTGLKPGTEYVIAAIPADKMPSGTPKPKA